MVNSKYKYFSTELRVAATKELVERVLAETGLSNEALCAMIAISPNTLRMYANGYQPASPHIYDLLVDVPNRTLTRARMKGGRQGVPGASGVLRSREGASVGPLTIVDKLREVVTSSPPDALAIVRAAIEAAHDRLPRRRRIAGSKEAKRKPVRYTPGEE